MKLYLVKVGFLFVCSRHDLTAAGLLFLPQPEIICQAFFFGLAGLVLVFAQFPLALLL